MERLEAARVGEPAPCANPSCPDGASVPQIVLYGRAFPVLCPRCAADAEARDAELERRRRREELLARSGVTPRMRGWTLATSPCAGEVVADVARWLVAYRAGLRRDLFLHGDAGRGKTGLAWSVVRDLIERDLTRAAIVNWRNLLAQMQASFGDGGRRVTTEQLYDLPVLALDDVGAEQPTDWRRDELATLIEHRYQRVLPTVYTSNYDLRALRLRWGHDDPVVGARIVSRIADDAVRVEVRGRDHRLPERAGDGSGSASVVRPPA